MLAELFDECRRDSALLEQQIIDSESEIMALKNAEATFKANYDRALTWGEMYKDSSIEGKKMIVRQLISKIYVSCDYSLRIEINLSYQQFAKLLGVGSETSERNK